MPILYPVSTFDRPDQLLGLVGAFWSDVYRGQDLVKSILAARGRIELQTQLDFLELLGSMSRFTIPLWHIDNWHLLTLKESDRNQTAIGRLRYDGTIEYDASSGARYGDATRGQTVAWAVTEDLVAARAIMNRLTEPSRVLQEGVDFVIREGAVEFRRDPFLDDLIPKRPILEGDEIVDQEIRLWCFRGEFDFNAVYRQFGYALGIKLDTSEGYRNLVNTVFDGLVQGTNGTTLEKAVSVLSGVPFVPNDEETVEEIFTDSRALWIVTNLSSYRFATNAVPTVAIGDTVRGGQFLVDTVEILEFNHGEVPDSLRGLALGRGMIGAGYFQDLVFENEIVPLIVEEDLEGRTKVSFRVSGVPADVEKFWDDVHARGIAQGKTLAQYLDVREEPFGEPEAINLPATVNPLGFLVQHLLRGSFVAVRLKIDSFGRQAVGLEIAGLLRRLVPPHIGLIVLMELTVTEDPIILDGPGDDEAPGVEETLTGFTGNRFDEGIDPESMVIERVKGRQLAGRCV